MSTFTKTGHRISAILLCAILLFSLIANPAHAAVSEWIQANGTVSSPSAPAFEPSSLDPLSYSHGTVSAWLEYDCGNGIMTSSTNRSYLQVAVDTDYSHFQSYCAALAQNANYTAVYTDSPYGCIGDSSTAVAYARYKAADGSHTVYVYILNKLKEVRITVDTNPDMTGIYADGFSYESTTGETAQPMIVMYGLSMAENGYSIDTSNTHYNTGKVNSGALIVIRMPDNSLFINDGGSVEQWNDAACDRFMTFLRELTGKSEGEKVVINSWFLSHAHTDHFEGFTRFVDHCHDQLDLKSVMYNIDGERLDTARDITYVGQLLRAYFPAVHYYKPHTGESFNIAGIEFDVLYTHEDRFYPTSNGQELIIDHLDGKSEYANHGSVNGTYREECFKETVYSYDTETDQLVATPTTFDYSDFNDTSTVLKVTFPAEIISASEDKTAILYGDVNRVDQTMLKVYNGTDALKTDIMLIPHHGHDAHPQLVEASEADVFFYTQKKSAIYGPNGIVDYSVDVSGTYRPALVYNYMAMQDHLASGRTYWQGDETVCLTFGAAQNLPSGMTRDDQLSASTGIYGYTCDTISFKYEGWTVVSKVIGADNDSATNVAITTKRIRFDQVTSLTNQGQYLIVHDLTDNVLMYNAIAREKGQTKPNLAVSLEVGSGQAASAGLVDAYYKVSDTSRPDVENKESIYFSRDKRDAALWILGQDGISGSGTALKTSSAMFGGSTAYASTTLYKGTSSDNAYWYSVSGNDYVDSSNGNQWRYLQASSSPVFIKDQATTNTIEFFDDGTCVIYNYTSSSSIRFLTITPEGNWVRKIYKQSKITDEVLASLKLRLYQYTTRSGAMTIAYNGPQTYNVLKGTEKSDVINSITSTFKVIDSSVRSRPIPCSGTTAKVGYYWLDGTISTSSTSGFNLTLKYRNDDGTDSTICTIQVNVLNTLDLGTVLSGSNLTVAVNKNETDGKICQVYHNANGYYTDDTVIALDMLTTKDGAGASSGAVGEYSNLTLTYNGQVLSNDITLTVIEEIPEHNCTDPQGHTWADATCETPKTCISCGNTEGEALGHSYSGGKCANCGDIKVVSINASFNDWNGDNMSWTESGYSFSSMLPAGTYEFKIVKDGTWLGNNSTIEDATSGYALTEWGENCPLVTTGGYYYFTFNFDTNQLSISFDHRHSYTVSEVVLPTCTSTGYTVYSCPCGSSYESNETPALDHEYDCTTTPPTCTEGGLAVYTCVHCGDSYSETTAALNHNYVGGKCSNCGDTKSVTVNGSFNNWDGNNMIWTENGYTFSVTLEAGTYMFKVIKDGTWLGNNGEIWDTTTATSDIGWEFTTWGGDCALIASGGTYTFTFHYDTNMLVITYDHIHNYSISQVVAPTCAAPGYTVYTCSGCDDSYTADEVAALGHSYETVVTAPTCTAAGYTTYTCATCGDSYVADEVAALGHSWVDADCDTAKTCSVCGTTDGTALGHSYEAVVTAPTCTAAGYTTYTCATCGDSYVADEVAALGHSWVDADCDTAKTCSVCGATDGTALGHSYEAVVTAPTCTAAGYTTYTCATCGDSYVADEVAALGHSWVDADCDTAKTCSVCGTTDGTALGHSYEAVVTAPTCTAAGYTTYTCANCGDSYVADEVAALGHSWVDADCDTAKTCSVCGATDGTALGHEAYTYSYASGTHSFKCTKCGETVTMAATDSKKFAINSAAPLLSDDIVMKYSTTVPAGFENAYMVFEFNGETFTFTEYEVNASNGRYEFKFPGINPQKMGDNICATLYATIDGVQVSVQIANYSLVKNCDNQLKKASLDAKTRTMLSDVLMYGEKAQIVTNYKTDVLVTSLLSAASTLTPSTYPDALDSSLDMQKRTGTKDARVQFTAVTLSLGSKMAVRVAVTCTDTSLFTYKVTVSGREYTYTGEDLVPVTDGSDGKYYLFFNQMKATEFGNKITFTCWEGDTQISYTIEYSVYTFIYRNFTKVDANTQELLKAIYNYGESTK